MENKTFSREDFDKLLELKSKYKIPPYRYIFYLKKLTSNKDFVDLCEVFNLLRKLKEDYVYGKDIDDEDINYIEQMINKIEEIVVIEVSD